MFCHGAGDIETPCVQRFVQLGRRVLPRGWSRILRTAAFVAPALREYPALMLSGETLYVDLRESMCHGYLYFGCIPHESGTTRLLRRVLGDGAVFVDVGANIGYFTREAHRLVGDSGRVFAFEPLPAALRLLRRNTAGLSNVEVRGVALSNFSGVARFYVRAHGDMSSLAPSTTSEESCEVRVSTIDVELAHVERVDILKIDVEGAEYDVLLGATSLLKEHQPVVYFELLDSYTASTGRDLQAFGDLLCPFGYELAWINHGNGPIVSDSKATYVVAIPPRYKALLTAV